LISTIVSFAQLSQKEDHALGFFNSLKTVHYGIYLAALYLTNKTIKGYTCIQLVYSLSMRKRELALFSVSKSTLNGSVIYLF